MYEQYLSYKGVLICSSWFYSKDIKIPTFEKSMNYLPNQILSYKHAYKFNEHKHNIGN
jgi:hypothetical protein